MADDNQRPAFPRPPPLFDNKFSEIVPKLFLGSMMAARKDEELLAYGVTHILSIVKLLKKPEFPEQFTYLVLEEDDNESSDLLTKLPMLLLFIEEGIRSGGVFVHCGQGVSRSATVCVAYLMSALGLTRDEALAGVKKIRPQVEPNRGFLRQLAVFEFMGAPRAFGARECARARLAHLASERAAGVAVSAFRSQPSIMTLHRPSARPLRIAGEPKGAAPAAAAPSPPVSEEAAAEGTLAAQLLGAAGAASAGEKGEAAYACAACQRPLLRPFNLLPHAHPADAPAPPSPTPACDVLFTEPLPWMGDVSADQGDILCGGCKTAIGVWRWGGDGLECRCGGRLQPAFAIRHDAVVAQGPPAAAAAASLATPPPRDPAFGEVSTPSQPPTGSPQLGTSGFGRPPNDAAPSAVDAARPTNEFGLYEIGPDQLEVCGWLGSGKNGAVYKGSYEGKCVAVKKFFLREYNSVQLQNERKKFINEFLVQSQLSQRSSSDRIVRIFGVISRESTTIKLKENIKQDIEGYMQHGGILLVMELMDGNLAELLRTVDLSMMQKLGIMRDICDALHVLHEAQPENSVFYNDFKLENVMYKIFRKGSMESDLQLVVKLSDFGNAKVGQATPPEHADGWIPSTTADPLVVVPMTSPSVQNAAVKKDIYVFVEESIKMLNMQNVRDDEQAAASAASSKGASNRGGDHGYDETKASSGAVAALAQKLQHIFSLNTKMPDMKRKTLTSAFNSFISDKLHLQPESTPWLAELKEFIGNCLSDASVPAREACESIAGIMLKLDSWLESHVDAQAGACENEARKEDRSFPDLLEKFAKEDVHSPLKLDLVEAFVKKVKEKIRADSTQLQCRMLDGLGRVVRLRREALAFVPLSERKQQPTTYSRAILQKLAGRWFGTDVFAREPEFMKLLEIMANKLEKKDEFERYSEDEVDAFCAWLAPTSWAFEQARELFQIMLIEPASVLEERGTGRLGNVFFSMKDAVSIVDGNMKPDMRGAFLVRLSGKAWPEQDRGRLSVTYKTGDGMVKHRYLERSPPTKANVMCEIQDLNYKRNLLTRPLLDPDAPVWPLPRPRPKNPQDRDHYIPLG